jgi:plasmid stabilization system protein ParE
MSEESKTGDRLVYEVRLAEPAEIEIEAAYPGRMRFGQSVADRWYAGLARALESLSQLPHRHLRAPESDMMGGEVRQMIYGRGRGAYRVLHRVFEPEEGTSGVVRILHVRHVARQRPGQPTDSEDRP